MPFINVTKVVIKPNRQRQVFDQALLQELVTDIRDSAHGLLHPIVLRQEGPDLVLVAGERRLRAVQDIWDLGGTFIYNGEPVPLGCIPYSNLGDLDYVDAMEAELSENIRRTDLSWQEKAKATADLMTLRQAQARRDDLPPPTVADLAVEIRGSSAGQAQDTTRQELLVSRHLDNPEVAKAGSVKEAFKILKKTEERRQNAVLAETLGKTFSSAKHSLHHADTYEWMKGQPDGQFAVILTDPPYGIGADEFGDSGQGGGVRQHAYDDSYETWRLTLPVFCKESFRLAAESAHAYLFCDVERFPELRTFMQEAGWNAFRTPLVWHNPEGFRAPWPDAGPQRKSEYILYATKGGRKTNHLAGDVLTYKRDASLGHPAQKPVALLVDLLRRSARPGDTVFDGFAGSGATIEACNELKLTCVAVEGDASSYGIAAKRLKGLSAFDEGLF